jgi:lysophospholipase L1-like esterase
VLSVFPLAVPGETTSALAERWWQECSLRFDGPAAGAVDRRLVLGLGHADVLAGKSVARCRLHLANLLDDAHSRRLPAFVVGPPPTADPQLNQQVEDYARTLGDACRRRDVPFVDTYTPLVRHEDWLTDLAAGDGVHPRQAGYGLLAWLVLHGGWYEWLGVPRP